MTGPDCGADWQGAYEAQTTPWDLRGTTGPLQRLVKDGFFGGIGLPEKPRVLLPMCGRGHDAAVFAGLGWQVTGLDIAPAAIEEARSLRALNQFEATFLVRDVLGLGDEFVGAFDLVFDYTSFCALPPHLRRTYVRGIANTLEPEGQLLMLGFPLDPEHAGAPGRPPFLVTEPGLDAAMAPEFRRVAAFAAEDSPPERHGAERWFHFRRTGR